MQLINKTVHDFESSVNDLNDIIATPIVDVSMHREAQVEALMKCIVLVREILQEMLALNTSNKTDPTLSLEEIAIILQVKSGMFNAAQLHIFTFFSDIAVFLSNYDRNDKKGRLMFDNIMAHMPKMCEPLAFIIEDFKGE